MFRRLHDFLVIQSEQGNISRQEAVSMIPPLMMDLKPNQTVKAGPTFIQYHACSADNAPEMSTEMIAAILSLHTS